MKRILILFISLVFSCNTGELEVIFDMPLSLKEVSAVEKIDASPLFWVLEDAGNGPSVYGIDKSGEIKKKITITNGSNKDWEDLASDSKGNLYIGDFGNNSRNRTTYTIYKISNVNRSPSEVSAGKIEFNLPEEEKQRDFEGFFLMKNQFYILSKDTGKFQIYIVPNAEGKHTASLLTEYNLDGKHNAITSADISEDGKTVVLLTHIKLWKLTGFKSDNFVSGNVEAINFYHSSQKEGICFISPTEVAITDEDTGLGSNLYRINLEKGHKD
ncbi:MAG: hypothetical protein R3213_03925 [Flavobacteriaceae bacterium]|nr:hypothetical protein [Flavobacteriaceae bacterium]